MRWSEAQAEPNPDRMGLTAPLRIRKFRLLFSAQVASNLGDWFDFLALAVLIAYVWEYGPTALAALALAVAVPWIFVAPFAGVVADRWPKRTVMVGADLARAALVIGFIFAPNIYVLLVLVGLKTAFSTLFQPAEQATIRMVVPEELLNAANALSQLVVQSTKVIGPALGGVVVGVTTPRVCFAIDAATFLISAAILSRMGPGRAEAIAEAEARRRASRRRLLAGAARGPRVHREPPRAADQHRHVRRGHVPAAHVRLAVGAGVPRARRRAERCSASRSPRSASAACSARSRPAAGPAALNPFVMLGGATAVIGGLVALMGVALLTDLDAPAVVWAPVLFVIGFASAGVFVASPTILQRETPPELMGRVSSTSYALPTVCQLAGPIVGAALAEWQSVGFVFGIAGGTLAAVGVVVFIAAPAGRRRRPGRRDSGRPGSHADRRRSHSLKVSRSPPGRGPSSEQPRPRRHYVADLTALKDSGMDVDSLPSEQQEALGKLDQSEVDALAAIRRKLDDNMPDVGGYAMGARADGYVVW